MEADLAKTDKKVAQAIDNLPTGEDNLIQLSSGVVLKSKKANPLILIRVMTAIQRPKPPLYFDKMMNREMENPDHPDYISRVEAWKNEYNHAMLNVLISLGTELHSVPKGMKDHNDDLWLKEYQALGLPIVKDSKSWRYTAWVMLKAAPTEEDVKAIGDKVKQLSGVQEAQVQSAENFSESS